MLECPAAQHISCIGASQRLQNAYFYIRVEERLRNRSRLFLQINRLLFDRIQTLSNQQLQLMQPLQTKNSTGGANSPNVQQMEAMLQNAETTFKQSLAQPQTSPQNQKHSQRARFMYPQEPKPWLREHRKAMVKQKLQTVYRQLALRDMKNPYGDDNDQDNHKEGKSPKKRRHRRPRHLKHSPQSQSAEVIGEANPSEYDPIDYRNKFGSLAPILYGQDRENSVRLKAPNYLKSKKLVDPDYLRYNEDTSLPWIRKSSHCDVVTVHANRSYEQIQVPKAKQTRNLSSLNSIEKLKQMIDVPGRLKHQPSHKSINPNGCLLVNDSSQKRIILLGDIVANTHQEKHARFLERKSQMINESDDEIEGAFSSSKPTESRGESKSAFGIKKSHQIATVSSHKNMMVSYDSHTSLFDDIDSIPKQSNANLTLLDQNDSYDSLKVVEEKSDLAPNHQSSKYISLNPSNVTLKKDEGDISIKGIVPPIASGGAPLRQSFNDLIKREPSKPSVQQIQARELKQNRNRKKRIGNIFDPQQIQKSIDASRGIDRSVSIDSLNVSPVAQTVMEGTASANYKMWDVTKRGSMESLGLHVGQKKKKPLELAVSNPSLDYKARDRSVPRKPTIDTNSSYDLFEHEPQFVYEIMKNSPEHVSKHMQQVVETNKSQPPLVKSFQNKFRKSTLELMASSLLANHIQAGQIELVDDYKPSAYQANKKKSKTQIRVQDYIKQNKSACMGFKKGQIAAVQFSQANNQLKQQEQMKKSIAAYEKELQKVAQATKEKKQEESNVHKQVSSIMGIQDGFFGGDYPIMKAVELNKMAQNDTRKKKSGMVQHKSKPERAAAVLAESAFNSISENYDINRQIYGDRARAKQYLKEKRGIFGVRSVSRDTQKLEPI